ncbi:hypothetical protein LshimejAT787_0112550 [Lyophyllum shimeji]|uniref:Uncharacterized protein n=1 Tax=Lyophyllum shimeji TaxID=47721 RepID=A0A9P3PEF9_LYOSH|nr:hypothetical protein LshimejAT787_0112550 [Lyophyllum shimeji]
MYSTRRTSGSHPLIPPDPALSPPASVLSPPASVLPPPASVLVPPDSPFLHRRIPDSRFIVAPRAPHITIQFLQGKGSLDLFSLDLPLPGLLLIDLVASTRFQALEHKHPSFPVNVGTVCDSASDVTNLSKTSKSFDIFPKYPFSSSQIASRLVSGAIHFLFLVNDIMAAISKSNIRRATRQDLLSNPDLLTHRKDLASTRTPFDGMVGSLVNDGHQIVLSPNVGHTFFPPLGTREMRLRKDFRYGIEDPLCGPQPYIAEFCHLAAIPRKPADADDPLSIMWRVPSKADFDVEPSNIVRGVGFLAYPFANSLALHVDKLQARVAQYSSDPAFPTKIPIISSMTNTLNDMRTRLYSLPMSFRQTQLCVSLVQRCYLELVGCLDYLYIFHPRMIGRAPPAVEVAHTVGAYVQDHAVIQEFVRAGLPVWVVKDWSSFVETRIDAVVPVRLPPTWAVLQDADPPFRPFFTGSVASSRKYMAFGQFARSSMSFPNPFAPTSPSTTSSVSMAASSGPVRGGLATPASVSTATSSGSVKGGLATPSSISISASSGPVRGGLTKQKKANPPYFNRRIASRRGGGRNKFVEIISPLLPPSVEVWREALEAVDTDFSNVRYNTTPADAGYVVPDPGLFVGIKSEEKTVRYLHNWLRNRPALLFRLIAPNSNARPIAVPLWRSLLNYGGASDDGRGQDAARQETLASTRREEIVGILGNALTETGIQTHSSTVVPTWKGKELLTTDMPPPPIVHEVMWELYELNFRFEFVALDSRISTLLDTPLQDRQDLIRGCFPQGHLLNVQIERHAEGLAAEDLSARAPYLLAMVKVMKSWHDCPLLLKDLFERPAEEYTEVEMVEIERVVARFYTQSFFNYFARAPIIPHRLNSPVSLMRRADANT